MGIQNFPAILQPILQQGFLEREFQQSMQSRLGYRACADRQEFAVGIGETLTKTRAGLIHQLDSNSGLATLLTQYAANYGDWKKLFTSIDDIEKVTAEDVQRVARKYFVPENKTVALTVQGETK